VGPHALGETRACIIAQCGNALYGRVDGSEANNVAFALVTVALLRDAPCDMTKVLNLNDTCTLLAVLGANIWREG
jgi:UDP-N-acetylglucosamine enolpyruvyl transferase